MLFLDSTHTTQWAHAVDMQCTDNVQQRTQRAHHTAVCIQGTVTTARWGACCTSKTGMNRHRVPLFPCPSADLCTARFCHLEAEGSPCLLLSPSVLLVFQSREFFIQKPFLAMSLFWFSSAMGKSHCLHLERALGIIMFYRVKNLSPGEGKPGVQKYTVNYCQSQRYTQAF